MCKPWMVIERFRYSPFKRCNVWFGPKNLYLHWSHPHNHGSVHETYTWSHFHKHGSGIPIAAWRTDNPVCIAFIPKKRDANQLDQIRGRIKYQRSISPKSIAKRDLLITVARLPLCLRVYIYIYIVAGSVLWFLTSWLFGDNQNRKLKIRMRKHHACLLLIVDYWERIDRFCIDH